MYVPETSTHVPTENQGWLMKIMIFFMKNILFFWFYDSLFDWWPPNSCEFDF